MINKLKFSQRKKINSYKIKDTDLNEYNNSKKEADAKLNLFLYAYTTSYKIIAILVYPFLMKSDYFGFLKTIIGLRLNCKSIFLRKMNLGEKKYNFLSNNLNFVKNIMFIMPSNILDENIQEKYNIDSKLYEENGTKVLIGNGKLDFFNVLNYCNENDRILSNFKDFENNGSKLYMLKFILYYNIFINNFIERGVIDSKISISEKIDEISNWIWTANFNYIDIKQIIVDKILELFGSISKIQEKLDFSNVDTKNINKS